MKTNKEHKKRIIKKLWHQGLSYKEIKEIMKTSIKEINIIVTKEVLK